MNDKKKGFITKDMMKTAIEDSFKKLNPKEMTKNPVMFVAYIGMIITTILTISPQIVGENGRLYNGIVTVILFATILICKLCRKLLQREEEKLKQML